MASLPRDAIPFLAVVVLAIVQSLTALVLRKRIVSLYSSWNDNKGITRPEDELPDHLHPEVIARLSVDWVGDAVQAIGAVTFPIFGFILLATQKLGNIASLVYLISVLLALSAWVFLSVTDRPDRYVKRKLLGMTPLTMAIIVVNLICAIGVSYIPSD